MPNQIKVKKSQVAHMVQATFPNYRGRKFMVIITPSVTFSELNWSGGTKSTYIAVDMSTGRQGRIPQRAPWAQPAEGQRRDLPPNVCVVEHAHFCGTDMGLRFYVHPDAAQRVLEGGK